MLSPSLSLTWASSPSFSLDIHTWADPSLTEHRADLRDDCLGGLKGGVLKESQSVKLEQFKDKITKNAVTILKSSQDSWIYSTRLCDRYQWQQAVWAISTSNGKHGHSFARQMVSVLLIKRAVYPEQAIRIIISGHLKNEFYINTFIMLTQNDEQSLKLPFRSSHVKDGIFVSRIHSKSSKMPCLQQLPQLMFCSVNIHCSEISAGAAEGEVA